MVILGVQLVSIGLVAEMVTRTYYETQQKAIYTVREWLRDDNQPAPERTPLDLRPNGKRATREVLAAEEA
jgi:hypothetical protein